MKKGFTLIELLVVISIIGILAGLTLTGFTAARKSARDTTRKSDLNQYRTAVEGYSANNQGDYPTTDGNSYNHTTNSIFDSASLTNPIVTEHLPSVIDDPTNNATYRYLYDYYTVSGVPSYSLKAPLETGGYWEICSNGKSCPKTGTAGLSGSCQCP